MPDVRNPAIPRETLAAGETEPVRNDSVTGDVHTTRPDTTHALPAPHPKRAATQGRSRSTSELQVRDNPQRTRFVLVWCGIDGTLVLATSRTFRTIREAMTEGIRCFGVLPIRWR